MRLLQVKRAFWCVQWHGFSIHVYLLFQAVHRAVNALNVSMGI